MPTETYQHKAEGKVQVDWIIPESLVTRYANQMTVQASGQEVVISFYELFPPFDPATWEKADTEDAAFKMRAVCISRMVMTTENAAKFMDVFRDSLGQINQPEKES